ncbi:hypothetical protein F5878DRAFT_666366 [Lentinula raphanica]|uniref:RING-type domain-containing protein n=1 Tax=Lentinula raphanica TaxID=153919 RepID=A0AA38NY33_9AGAR|nr:hypothetical protein F5878DRAFT_666366 [Lentinula raphanica]
MPTAGSSTSITRARGSANDPPYSPPKVIRKYGTKHNNRKRRSNPTAASVDEQSQLLPCTDQGNHSQNISALEKEPIDISDSEDDDGIAPVVSPDENIKQDLRKTLEELATVKEQLALLRDAAEERNTCIICYDLISDPRSLACGHAYCASCITSYAKTRAARRQNAYCPKCRVVVGRFTPIFSYHIKDDVETFRQVFGIEAPVKKGLNWPKKFKTKLTPLPFPRENDDNY